VGSVGSGGGPRRARGRRGPVFPPRHRGLPRGGDGVRGAQAQVLEEGEGELRQQRVVVQPDPGAPLEVIQPQLLLELLVRLLHGLITNDKFCLTRRTQLRLSWPRARWAGRAWPSKQPPDEVTHRGGEHAAPAAARVARPAERGADGGRAAALGSGVPVPPAVGDPVSLPRGGAR
jgi:hypothetical protein